MPSRLAASAAASALPHQRGQLTEHLPALLFFQVPAKQRAAVLDLAEHELPGEGQRPARVGGRGELGDPQLDVLMDHADGHGVEPAAVGEVAHGDAGGRQLAQGLRRDLHVAEQGDLRGIDQLRPAARPPAAT